MRNDGYHDGGPEPLKPKGANYKLAVEILSELDCECEPSETTCDRCAALSDLHAAECAYERRGANAKEALRALNTPPAEDEPYYLIGYYRATTKWAREALERG